VAAALLPHRLQKQIRGRTTGYDDIKYMAKPDTAVKLELMNQNSYDDSGLSYSVRRSDSTELPATSAK
jgi:hypothetical protein